MLALAATILMPAPAGAAEKAIWGPVALPDGQPAFPLYEQLGVDTLQIVLGWDEVAPTRPGSPRDARDAVYRWPSDIDRALDEGKRHGIDIALLVQRAPRWANGGRSPIWAPRDPGDFAQFIAAAARRYPAVRRWMIWSEPNKSNRFQPNRARHPVGARAYAPLLDAAYGALKRENRRNRVIGGMTWTGGTVKPPDFIRWMRLASGRAPRLDWFGHNPFPYRMPDLAKRTFDGFRDISDLDTLGREVRRAYHRTVPLWLSEYTVQTDRKSRIFATFVSQRDQARYLRAGFRIADDLGRRVAGIGWLALLDEPPAPPDSANWGVMTYALARKPAFAALARAPSRRLAPAVSAPASLSRSTLRAGGLAVTLLPRVDGRITLELRRGSRLLDGAGLRAANGARRTLRLRPASASAGRYQLVVRATRGETIRRFVRVR